MGIPLFDLLTMPCRTSLVKWQSKGKSRNNTCLLTNKFNRVRWNKVTNLIVQGGTRFSSPRNVFPRLVSISLHVSGYTTAARHVLPFITAVALGAC